MSYETMVRFHELIQFSLVYLRVYPQNRKNRKK